MRSKNHFLSDKYGGIYEKQYLYLNYNISTTLHEMNKKFVLIWDETF